MDHRILCIEEEEGQIVAVGTGGDDGVAHRRWEAAEVRRAIGEGDCFYVVSPITGAEPDLQLSEGELTAAHDEMGQECLHTLRPCRWR